MSATFPQMSPCLVGIGGWPSPYPGTSQAWAPAPSAHMASSLLFLMSQGLFLTMAPSQMPDFTEFLQLGTYHRANVALIVFLHRLDASPLLSSSVSLTDASVTGDWTHSIDPFSLSADPASPHGSLASTNTCTRRYVHTGFRVLTLPVLFFVFRERKRESTCERGWGEEQKERERILSRLRA